MAWLSPAKARHCDNMRTRQTKDLDVTRQPKTIAIITVAFALAAITLSQSLVAGSLWMDDHDLRTALAGREISGQYANGTRFDENYHADGSLTYNETGRNNTGRWSIIAGTFCTIYDTDTTGGCYQVARIGSNCFEFYFIARTKKQATKPRDRNKPAWTARAWLPDEQSTCEDESTV